MAKVIATIAEAISGQALSLAKRELAIQRRLQRMQIVVARGLANVQRQAFEAAGKLYDGLVADIATLEELKQKPVSSFDALRQIYNTDLANATREGLAAEATVMAEKVKARIYGGPNKAQEAVIDAYFALRATSEWNTKTKVKIALDVVDGDHKAAIAGVKSLAPNAPVVEPAMAPAEA